ncbi:acyl-coenzyme A thioesterase 3-like [Diretmus argenteus]
MTSTVSPVLSVFPKRGLLDEKFKLVVENLPPGLPVTLHSLHHTDDKDTLEAYGHYISDDRGTVTVSDDVSIGGTYTGKELMGLLWSMHPVPGSRPGISWRKKDVHTPMVVLISVYRGHVVEGFNEQPPMASVVTERWYMAPGVQRIDIEERGVRGTLFLPPAFNILQEHPLVINDRVGVFSFSFGVLLTFSMAACSKIATPRCCVCVNGTHVPRFNKSTSDALAHINKDMDKIPLNEENHTALRFPAYGIPTDPMKKVEITKMMRAAGNEHLLNTLTYPNAGHLIEPPYKPHCRASHYIQWNTRTKVFVLWGGQAKPHADAEEDSWMKILAFLRQHLQPDPNVIPPDNKL